MPLTTSMIKTNVSKVLDYFLFQSVASLGSGRNIKPTNFWTNVFLTFSVSEPAVTESGESYVDQSLTMSQEPTSIFVDTLDAFEVSLLTLSLDVTDEKELL